MELISCAIVAAQAQAIQLQDALEMSEEHLDLLSLAACHEIRVGGGDRQLQSCASLTRQSRFSVACMPGGVDAPGFNVTAFELTEARLLFEGEAAALAATQISEAELAELDDLVRDIAQGNDDGDGEVADRAFHLLIARATRNTAIVKTVDELWELRSTSPECALLHEKARTAQVKPVVEEHREIVEALRSRDPARARAAMHGHLGAVIDHLLFATEEKAVEEARRAAQSTRARYSRSVVA